MELILKALIISAICAAVGLILKKNNPEISLLVVVAAAAAVLFFAFDILTSIVEFLKEIAASADIEPAVISTLLKAVGIGIITKFSSDVCKDAGQTAVGSSVEFLGSVAVIYTSLPLIKTVIKNINYLQVYIE